MGCCGCFVASVFRKNPWFLRGFRAFRTTACCVPLDAVSEASRRAPREFEAILGGVGGSGARPLKLALLCDAGSALDHGRCGGRI